MWTFTICAHAFTLLGGADDVDCISHCIDHLVALLVGDVERQSDESTRSEIATTMQQFVKEQLFEVEVGVFEIVRLCHWSVDGVDRHHGSNPCHHEWQIGGFEEFTQTGTKPLSSLKEFGQSIL